VLALGGASLWIPETLVRHCLGITIQRGNALSVLETFASGVTSADLSFEGDDFDYILARLFLLSSHPFFSVSPRHVRPGLPFAFVLGNVCFRLPVIRLHACTIFVILFECFLLHSVVFKIYFEFLMLQFGWFSFFYIWRLSLRYGFGSCFFLTI